MTTDSKYSEVLLELRTHYQQTLAELEAQTNQLKTRLTSLDTLVEDPLLGADLLSVLQGEVDSLTSAAPASAPKTTKTVKPKAENKPKKVTPKASPLSGKRKPATSQKSASAPKSTKSVEPKAEDKNKKTDPKASLSSSKKKPAAPKKEASQAKTKNKKTQKKTSSASSSSRPMQWPYTEMYKIDAIAQIMRENAGNSVHIDDLIVQLYGELSGDDLKVERDRVYKTMQSGVQKNRWRKDPKVSMSYIAEGKS